jgi:hypothetical protein
MPVQINEIVIKVAVDEQASGSGSSNSPATDSAINEAAVAEMVLEILKAKKER